MACETSLSSMEWKVIIMRRDGLSSFRFLELLVSRKNWGQLSRKVVRFVSSPFTAILIAWNARLVA